MIRDTFLFLCDLLDDYKKRIENQRLSLPFAINVMLNLSNILSSDGDVIDAFETVSTFPASDKLTLYI